MKSKNHYRKGSCGSDVELSRRRQGFDSPTGYHSFKAPDKAFQPSGALLYSSEIEAINQQTWTQLGQMMSVSEFANVFGISPRTIKRWCVAEGVANYLRVLMQKVI